MLLERLKTIETGIKLLRPSILISNWIEYYNSDVDLALLVRQKYTMRRGSFALEELELVDRWWDDRSLFKSYFGKLTYDDYFGPIFYSDGKARRYQCNSGEYRSEWVLMQLKDYMAKFPDTKQRLSK